MSVRVTASPNGIEQKSMLQALKRIAPKVLIASPLAAALTFGLLSLAAPRFQSKAELVVLSGAAAKDAETHVRGLTSPDILARVADDLKFRDRPEFNPALGATDTLDTVLRFAGLKGSHAMRDSVSVSVTGDRRFSVHFTSRDSSLAADAANRIADVYARSIAPEGLDALSVVRDALKRQSDVLSQSLQSDKAQISRRRNEVEAATGVDVGAIDQRLAVLSDDLLKAKSGLKAADEQVLRARDLVKKGASVTRTDAEPFPIIDDLTQQRARADRQMAELKSMLNPAHPRVRQIDAELARLKKRIAGEVSKVVEGAEADAKVAAAREDAARTHYDAFKARVDSVAPQRGALNKLEVGMLAKQGELNSKQQQLAESQKAIDKLAATPGAEVVARAQPSKVALPTKNALIAGFVFLATLLLGTALAVTMALWAAKRDNVANALGETPERRVSSVAMKSAQGSNEISISAVADRLAQARSPQGGHRTLVTAAVPDGIDAGVEAFAIAERLAEAGASVILLDWNRHGVAGTAFTAMPSTPGLNDLIMGSSGFEDSVRRIPGTGVHAIACGNALPEGHYAVDANLMNLVLDALDEAYDHIIVAGPHREARYLFEVILGRFDACISVADGPRALRDLEDLEGTFLGFPVADIDVIRFKRVTVMSVPSRSPLSRIGRSNGLVAAS